MKPHNANVLLRRFWEIFSFGLNWNCYHENSNIFPEKYFFSNCFSARNYNYGVGICKNKDQNNARFINQISRINPDLGMKNIGLYFVILSLNRTDHISWENGW